MVFSALCCPLPLNRTYTRTHPQERLNEELTHRETIAELVHFSNNHTGRGRGPQHLLWAAVTCVQPLGSEFPSRHLLPTAAAATPDTAPEDYHCGRSFTRVCKRYSSTSYLAGVTKQLNEWTLEHN